MNTFQKYPKDWMITAIVVLAGVFAVMGWHWTDTAVKPFWWKFWPIIAIGGLVFWVVGWVVLNSKSKNK